MSKMKPLTNSKAYRDWTQQRNRALEHILDLYLTRVDTQLIQIRKDLRAFVLELHDRKINPTETLIRTAISNSFDARHVVRLAHQLRMTSYTLAYAGEAHALARLFNGAKIVLDREKRDKVLDSDSPSGGSYILSIELYFAKLRDRVINALHASFVRGKTLEETLAALDKAFPPTKIVKVPQRKLPKPKRIKEAKNKKPTENDALLTGVMDDDAWDAVVQDYLDANIPPLRGPTDKVRDYTKPAGEQVRYTWEVEKEMTHDFVSQVRRGQIDAAEENGIKDFQWIAIIDNRTDECCLWRDGLTSTEIREELKGNHSDDECQTDVPPAHFNCRCDIAPVSEQEPEKKSELGNIEDWLED